MRTFRITRSYKATTIGQRIALISIKEQSLYVVEKLQNIADKRNVKLKLIKKK